MKYLSTFLLLLTAKVILSESSFLNDFEKGTISDAFEGLSVRIKSIPETETYYKITRKINYKCAADLLKLHNNGNKMVNELQGMIIVGSAFVKCVNADAEEVSIAGMDFAINAQRAENDETFRECLKYKVRQLEPTSQLVENFNIASMNTSTDLCDLIFSEESLRGFAEPIESYIGPIETSTCGAANSNDPGKYMLKIFILTFERNEAIARAEKIRLGEDFKAKLHKTAECILKGL